MQNDYEFTRVFSGYLSNPVKNQKNTDAGITAQLFENVYAADNSGLVKQRLEEIRNKFSDRTIYYFARWFSDNAEVYLEELEDKAAEYEAIKNAYDPIKKYDTGMPLFEYIVSKECADTLYSDKLEQALFVIVCYNEKVREKSALASSIHKTIISICDGTCSDFNKELKRNDLFKLGHALRMSYDDMNRILVRVYQDGYWNPKSCEDSLEALAFHLELSNEETDALKLEFEDYRLEAEGELELDDYDGSNITRFSRDMMSDSKWKVNSGRNREKDRIKEDYFSELATLLEDIGEDYASYTALNVYRCVFESFYEFLAEESYEEFEEFEDAIMEGLDDDMFLTVADLEESLDKFNLLFREDSQNRNNPFEDIKSEVYQQYKRKLERVRFGYWKGGCAEDRIRKIFKEKTEVTRTDLIFLLFVAFSSIVKEQDDMNREKLNGLCKGFIRLSDEVLKKAGLQGFYAPHPVEYSIIISILLTDEHNWSMNPFATYEFFCEAEAEQKREANSKAAERMQENRRLRKLLQQSLNTTDCFGIDKVISDDIIRRIIQNQRDTGNSQLLTSQCEIGRYRAYKDGIFFSEFYDMDEGRGEKVKDAENLYTPRASEFATCFSEKDESDKKVFMQVLARRIEDRVLARYGNLKGKIKFVAPKVKKVSSAEDVGVRLEINKREQA